MAVGRQEVDGAAGLLRLLDEGGEGGHGAGFTGTALLGHRLHGVDGTVPDDVVDVNLIAQKEVAAAVSVQNADEAVALLAEEIEERTVLTEFVGIGRVVVGAVVVAEKEHQTRTDQLAQFGAASSVCLFGE